MQPAGCAACASPPLAATAVHSGAGPPATFAPRLAACAERPAALGAAATGAPGPLPSGDWTGRGARLSLARALASAERRKGSVPAISVAPSPPLLRRVAPGEALHIEVSGEWRGAMWPAEPEALHIEMSGEWRGAMWPAEPEATSAGGAAAGRAAWPTCGAGPASGEGLAVSAPQLSSSAGTGDALGVPAWLSFRMRPPRRS